MKQKGELKDEFLVENPERQDQVMKEKAVDFGWVEVETQLISGGKTEVEEESLEQVMQHDSSEHQSQSKEKKHHILERLQL